MTDRTLELGAPGWLEADRLAALRRFGILDTGPETAFDDIARIAAQVCGTPIAAVNFIDEQRQWFKAAIGLGVRETSLDVSICAHAILQSGLFVVPDIATDSRFRARPPVIDGQRLRFYAGVPLETDEGLPLGMVCVLDRGPRPEGLTREQSEGLFALARAVMDQLRLRVANSALVEQKRELAALTDGLPQMVWSLPTDGCDGYANRRWHEFTGATPGSVRRGSWTLALHPEDRERVSDEWRHALETGHPYEAECRLRHRSGAYRWVLTRALPCRDEQSRIERWVGTHTDIDAWKVAERALAESQERHKALIEASAVAVWGTSPDGAIRYAKGTAHIGGFAEEVYQGMGWVDEIHPDDRSRVVSAWQVALASGALYQNEARIRVADGEYRWMLVSGVPLMDSAGAIREWVGSVTDIHDRKQTEDKLQASEARLRLAVEATSLGIWDVDLRTCTPQWTREMHDILGVAAEARIDQGSFLRRVHPDDRPEVEAIFYRKDPRAGSGNELSYSATFRIIRADTGEERWVAASGRTLFDDAGIPIRKVGTLQDVTEQKRAELALQASEERLRLALHAGRMIAWEHDLKTNHVTRSRNAIGLLGIGSGPLSDFLQRVHPADRNQGKRFSDMLVGEGTGTIETRYCLPDGTVLWLATRGEKAGPDRVVGVSYDVTDRKIAEEEVWRSANHDALTGLPNRVLFQRRLEQALAAAKRNGTCVSLLLLDLDDFKDVNDTLGHDAGDALLQETAVRLSAMVRDCDTVARLGGDEFAVLVVDPLALEHAVRFANIVIDTLRQPFTYQQWTLASRASIGVAAFPDHHGDPAELMKSADIALYRAKGQGRNRVVAYSWTMRRQIEERFALVRDVREAIGSERFVPFYQPKVCLSTGRITGFEALARWQDPQAGLLTPEVFSGVFDNHELAAAIGRQMMARVAADMRSWLDRGLDIGRVALNLSSAEFGQSDLADGILSVLTRAGVPPEHFEIEITESVFLSGNADAVIAALKRFRSRNVRIALDDFGTGYASLAHLKQFPVDHLKIDQTFVRDLERGRDDVAIVKAVIGLGRSLDLLVTAEGVETASQAERLRAMGCHDAQGYLFAKPLMASDVPGLLANGADGAAPGHEQVSRR